MARHNKIRGAWGRYTRKQVAERTGLSVREVAEIEKCEAIQAAAYEYSKGRSTLKQVAERMGISERTLYRWKRYRFQGSVVWDDMMELTRYP